MIQSMTGFSEKSFHSSTLQAKISIKSLNHRFFDWSFKGPSLGGVENRLRAVCQKRIHRGRIEVSFDLVFLNPSSWDISVNEALLDKILSSLERTSRRLGKSVNFSVENIFRIPQVIELRRKDLTRQEAEFLENSLEKTLNEVLKERIREGKEIAKQVKRHIRNIKKAVRLVEGLAKEQFHQIRERIRQRLGDMNQANGPSEGRLEEEVSFLAQRSDITEEVVRLKSHLTSLQELIQKETEGEPAGKMLDFLAQELHREANTINSKSQDIKIIRESLVVKREVESVRQNVQNLE